MSSAFHRIFKKNLMFPICRLNELVQMSNLKNQILIKKKTSSLTRLCETKFNFHVKMQRQLKIAILLLLPFFHSFIEFYAYVCRARGFYSMAFKADTKHHRNMNKWNVLLREMRWWIKKINRRRWEAMGRKRKNENWNEYNIYQTVKRTWWIAANSSQATLS